MRAVLRNGPSDIVPWMPAPTGPARGATPRHVRASRQALWLACSVTVAALVPSAGAAAPTGFTVEEPATVVADPGAARFGRHNIPAWPIYVRWDSEDGRSLRVFGPVTAFHRTRESSAFYPVWPVTGTRRWTDGRRSDHVLWPFVYADSDPRRGTWSVNFATPLLSLRSARGPGWHDLSFLPLYASQRTPRGRRMTMLAPLRRQQREPLGHRLDDTWGFVPIGTEPIWWLFRRLRDESGQGWNSGWLYGAWSTDRSRLVYLPPYVHLRRTLADGRRLGFDLLLPLYLGVRGREVEMQAAAPAWWRYRSPRLSSTGFWPFYASFERTRPDSTVRRGASIAWPLFTWGHGEDWSSLGLLPFWLGVRDGERRFAAAPPVYWDFRSPGRATRVIAPFYASHVTPAETTTVVLTGWRHRRAGWRSQGVLPFWLEGASADSGYRAVLLGWYHSWSPRRESRFTPLMWGEWRSKTDGSVTRLTGPVLTTRGPGTRGFGVLPLFYTTRGPASSRTLVGPVFTSSNAAGVRHVVVAPLAWHRSSPRGSATDLLPLTGWRSAADGRRFVYVLGPVFTQRVNGPDDRVSAVFGWLWRDERHGERHRSMLQPLWYLERRAADDVFFSLLGGLLASYERAGSERLLKVLFVPLRRWSR